jgi:hypothetical protein
MASAVERMERLGRAGLTVSVCCGPCGDQLFRWTVQVASADFAAEFLMPYAAHNFDHAIEIAELEAVKRQWLPDEETRKV